MTDQAADIARGTDCPRCEGKGWYWRTPEGFNPFLAGGFNTARAMYKVECGPCQRRKALNAPGAGSGADGG